MAALISSSSIRSRTLLMERKIQRGVLSTFNRPKVDHFLMTIDTCFVATCARSQERKALPMSM